MNLEASAASAVRLAIIGAGQAGRQFALRCLESGQSVVLEDVLPAKLRTAAEEFAEQHLPSSAHLQLVSSVEDAVRDADLVVDFVPDELESKLEIFSLIDRMAPPRTILLTPSETLSVADLASCTYRSDRCFALRGLADGLADVAAQADNTLPELPLLLTYPACRDEAALALVQAFLVRLKLPSRAAQDELPSMLTGR